MSFEETYQAAKNALLGVRNTLIGKILEAPVGDADAMKSYYEKYRSFQESVPLEPKVSVDGRERMPYLGDELPDRVAKMKLYYDGPKHDYVDYGQTPNKTYSLPSVPIIEWTPRSVGELGEKITKEQVQSNFAIYSTEILHDVEPDFQNAEYYYYFPTDITAEELAVWVDVVPFGEESLKVILDQYAVQVQRIKGHLLLVVWGQFPGSRVAWLFPNPEIEALCTPLPGLITGDVARDEVTAGLHGVMALNFYTENVEYQYIFFNHRIKAKSDLAEGWYHNPLYIMRIVGGKLSPPKYVGRVKWGLA